MKCALEKRLKEDHVKQGDRMNIIDTLDTLKAYLKVRFGK